MRLAARCCRDAPVAERTFSWLGRHRCVSKDSERLLFTIEAFIDIVGIQLLLARLTQHWRRGFRLPFLTTFLTIA